MSKKRNTESCNDAPATEGSDVPFQENDDAKRARLASLSDTTLQDLPIEILEYILVGAVAMEVKAMKLVKRVWKDKADLVIWRLSTVCSQWSYIVMNDFFHGLVHRILDGTAQETIRLEILHQSPLQWNVYGITTLRDEIFLLCQPDGKDHSIRVYERNNMAEVKEVVPLPGVRPEIIAASNVSNCVFIINRNVFRHYSILSLGRVDDGWSLASSPITGEIRLPHPTLSVAANGSLILSRQQCKTYAAIMLCDATGSIQYEIRLTHSICDIGHIIPKSNGNLLLVSLGYPNKLVDIDMAGTVIRQYQPHSFVFPGIASQADSHGRLLVGDCFQGVLLLDSEFNLMDFTQMSGGQAISPLILHYNSERNEIVAKVFTPNFPNGCLTIFQLREI